MTSPASRRTCCESAKVNAISIMKERIITINTVAKCVFKRSFSEKNYLAEVLCERLVVRFCWPAHYGYAERVNLISVSLNVYITFEMGDWRTVMMSHSSFWISLFYYYYHAIVLGKLHRVNTKKNKALHYLRSITYLLKKVWPIFETFSPIDSGKICFKTLFKVLTTPEKCHYTTL